MRKDKESLRAEKEAHRAEEVMTTRDKLHDENMELKERICNCNKMMLKELRLIQKQQKEIQELKYRESCNMQNARKVLSMSMEFLEQHGFSLSPCLRKLCQGFSKTDHLNFANLEYLDLHGGRSKTSTSLVQRTVSCS